jgi:hypothetical protein
MLPDETRVSMRFSRGQLVVFLLIGSLCCTLGTALAVAGGSPPESADPATDTGFVDVATEEFEADRTVFAITLQNDRSARWVFRYEQRLESDGAATDFRSFADRFNSEETESYRNFRNRAISLTGSGRNVTGRNMSAEAFDRDARIEERGPAGEEFAVLEMSFVWTAFAERDGDRRVVGDVFAGGLYVGPDQELRFERGPDVRFESVEPTPDSTAAGTLADSESISWIGEVQFTDRHPRVVYLDRDAGTDSSTAGTDSAAADSGSDPDTDSTSTPTGGSSGTGRFVPLVAIAIVLLLGVGGAIAYRSDRLRPAVDTIAPGTETDVADATDPAASVDSDTERGTNAGSVDHTPAEAEATLGGGSVPAVTDEELLSDEERVIALLEEHGGRMKQVDIVGNTNWSKSKVSMLLSEMESEGTISKLRVGRENIVSLAGHEPDAAGSPFDDE